MAQQVRAITDNNKYHCMKNMAMNNTVNSQFPAINL